MNPRRLLELNLAVGKKEVSNGCIVGRSGIARRVYIDKDVVYIDAPQGTVPFNPCEYRNQGDDIIDRERITTGWETAENRWHAIMPNGTEGCGETRLIAAMRAYTGLREPTELRNGDIWESKDGRRLLAQFLGGQQWVLLSPPERSCQGGSVMIPWTFGLANNQTIGLSDQFIPLLLNNGWILVGTANINVEVLVEMAA
jgi:hypothetical protein